MDEIKIDDTVLVVNGEWTGTRGTVTKILYPPMNSPIYVITIPPALSVSLGGWEIDLVVSA